MKKFIIMIFIIFLLFYAIKAEDSISDLEKEVKIVLKKVSPSIVKVVSQNHRNYYATGIVLDNHHVITNTIITRYPYKSIYIKTVAGKNYPAEIVGKDNHSSILVLKIGDNDLVPIKQAGKYAVGDWIALVGAFYNKFPSINQGLLSSASEDDVILNAPVVPGISGGAVVNKNGDLIGVIRGRLGFTPEPDYTFKDHSSEILVRSPRSKSQNLCVAVPIKKVNRISEDLIKYGKIRNGWLGVSIDFTDNNVLVGKVVKGSPAEKGGIKIGDVILSIDEKPIASPGDVVEIIKSLRPEQKSRIKILRDKVEKIVETTIGELKEKDYRVSIFRAPEYSTFPLSTIPEQKGTFPEKWHEIPKLENFIFNISGSRALGIDTLTLTPELAQAFSVKEGFGLLVSKIHEKSAAEKSGIHTADIIVAINNQAIKRLTDIRKELSKLEKSDDPALIKLYRGDKIKEIEVYPDKDIGFDYLYETFDSLPKKIDIKKKLEEDEIEKEIIELRGGNLIINGKRYDLDQVKKYQIKLEALQKQRDQYKKEVQLLKEKLEWEKNRKKKAT